MRLIKQQNLPWIGAFTESLFSTLPLLSILNFLSIMTVLYTSISQYLIKVLPWLTFGWFVVILVVITLCAMLGVYLFILPSLWTFRNKQMNAFESDLLKEVRQLQKEIADLKEEIKKEKNA
jgi:uncharacterized protein YlxW (UPF0749 family)